MGQFGTLGRAGGTRRVQDDRGVRPGPVDGTGHRRRTVVEVRADDEAVGAGLSGTERGGFGAPRRGEDEAGLRVAEVVGDLALLQQRVHRYHDGTGAQDAVVDDRELGDVGQHDRDPVTRAHLALAQQSGDPGAALVEVRIGQHGVVEPDGRAVRVRPGGADEIVGEVHGGPFGRELTDSGRRDQGRTMSMGTQSATPRLCPRTT